MSTSSPNLTPNALLIVEASVEDGPMSFKSFIAKCLDLLALAVTRLKLPAPSKLLHRAKNGRTYILPFFVKFSEAVLLILLVGQTHLTRMAVKSLDVVDSDVMEKKFLSHLILDAKSKMKMSAFALGLVFTLMQVIAGDIWPTLTPFLSAYIMVVFVSIGLHTVASSCYQVILQNPEGAARWFLHTRTMTDNSFALDPWIALSIPSAWTLWSFILFFVMTLMSALDYSPFASAVSLTTSVHADVLRASQAKSITAVFVVLVLGLVCCLLVVITWRPYLINRGESDAGRALSACTTEHEVPSINPGIR